MEESTTLLPAEAIERERDDTDDTIQCQLQRCVNNSTFGYSYKGQRPGTADQRDV